MQDLTKTFENPDASYRGKPFWSWNGDLKEDELRRQVRVMREMGMGGFFMHSRTGLITEYLSQEWFDLTNSCAQEAEEHGLEAWLYDEDRWPSGTAGGLVTQNPQFRARMLSLRHYEGSTFEWNDGIFAAFSCHLEGLAFTDCTRIFATTLPADYQGKTILVFSIEEMEKSSFYNGFTYVDTMQRAATDEYIRLTHEAYKTHCGQHLGKSIKGIFTDEPHRGPVMAGFGLSNENRQWMTPWTAALPQEFQQRFGSDLVEQLPWLFLQSEGHAVHPAKWQYMELTQQLFLENYAKPLFDWCESNDMLLTGHVLHEDNLTAQATMQGSLMRFYEYMHYPGIDILSEGNRNYWVVKQLASAARQLGQKWLLSELYGCTGWQMSFENHKAVGDWQTLFGINLRCHHLSWYTMEGEAKRDYPASIFYQSAWWQEYHHVETYFSRLGFMLSQGKPACEILVINPVESLWCQIHAGWVNGLSPQGNAIHELEAGYQQLFFWLAGAHLDFDYGDEEMLGRLFHIGSDPKGHPVLHLGEATYRTVIVGRMTTMRSSTLRILENFQQAGGQVIFVGDPPAYVDAVPSEAALQLSQRTLALPWDKNALVSVAGKTLGHRVEILDAVTGEALSDIFCQLRLDEGQKILVALNTHTERDFPRVLIRLHDLSQISVTEWNCLSGERTSIPAEIRRGTLEFETAFPASGEHVYTLECDSRDDAQLLVKKTWRETGREVCPGPFRYTLNEPNVCVLDMARFRMNDGPWQDELEVLKVDQSVRRSFELPLRSGEMVQPWFRNKTESGVEVKGQVELEFDFFIEALPNGPVHLCVERPEQVTIFVNGKALDPTPQGWWVDNAFQKLEVPLDFLKQGSNIIGWQVDFHAGINVEALYLIGDFGVQLRGTEKTLTRLPQFLHCSDLTAQGLPFYSGAVTYSIPVPESLQEDSLPAPQLSIEVPQWEGACIKVRYEERESLIAWQPYRAELGAFEPTENFVELEVILTRRNTFGPLHQIPLLSASYGPGNFITEGRNFSSDYVLYPAGLLRDPEMAFGQFEKIFSQDEIDISQQCIYSSTIPTKEIVEAVMV